MQIFQFKNRNYNRTVNCLQTFEEAGVTDWVPLSGKIAVQVTGSASQVSFMVERSVSDPAGPMGANPASVEETETKGDPTSGMSPTGYFEPSTAWWRVRVINVAEGSVLIALSGALGGDLV